MILSKDIIRTTALVSGHFQHYQLFVGSIVIILKNYIVEEKPMNGFIGTVNEIVYHDY